ncbi:MAG: pyridoxamine 5'-phosphate oxidase family protein [Anaerolineaceae bacterium]
MDHLSDEKKHFIDTFLEAPRLARMATVDKQGQPHVVPVWYGWDGESIWISAYADTRKIKNLEENPLISIAVDEVGESEKTSAVILEGQAQLLREPREFLRGQFLWIYKRYVGEEHIMEKTYQEWIEDPLNTLIKLTPRKVSTWNW